MDSAENRKNSIFGALKGLISDKSGAPDAPEPSPLARRTYAFIQKLAEGKANWVYWLGLLPVLFVTWYVRTRNLPLLAGKYLIELDSYFFFRYAKIIYEQGALPVIDMMRYSPVGHPTAVFRFFPTEMAYLYKLVHIFAPGLQQIQWHIIYPPVLTIASFIFFFLFVKELFNHKTALLATAFLAVIPAYIQRTSAGFADHESLAMFWVFISLWLYVLMWKSNKIEKSVIFGLLAGLFAGAATITWGGGRLLNAIISTFFIVALLFNAINKQRFVGQACWAAIYIAIINIYFQSGISASAILTVENALPLLGIFAGAIYLLPLKIKVIVPKNILSVLLAGAISMAFAASFGVITKDVLIRTFAPNPVRWAATVAESQQPSFYGGGGWLGSYGNIIWLALLGCAFLLYKVYEIKSDGELLQKIKTNKYAIAALATYFSFVWVFTKGYQGAFSKLYLPWLVAAFVLLGAIYYLAQRHGEKFYTDKNKYLFAFVFIFIALLVTNTYIRLLFLFAPAAAIGVAVFLIAISELIYSFKKARLLVIGVAILALVVLNTSFDVSIGSNQYMGSMVPGQWNSAMAFLRDQTPKDSVVAHWWDYGHMTIVVGERAAVTDGGNLKAWNHASGRYFLTGKDATSTMEYLKTHKVTHILISDQEIPKYAAFSLIGSDENFDRYSNIGVFVLQDTREARDGLLYLYGGGWSLDQNIVLGNMVLPAGGAQIAGFSLMRNNNTITEPKVYISYAGKQIPFDLSCIYKNGVRLSFPETQSTLRGCIVIVPYFKDQTQGNEEGAAFWASEKVWDTNFARLYLYSERDPRFKLVYQDDMPFVVFQGRPIGPIKIWEVQYPPGVKEDPKYLEPSPYG